MVDAKHTVLDVFGEQEYRVTRGVVVDMETAICSNMNTRTIEITVAITASI